MSGGRDGAAGGVAPVAWREVAPTPRARASGSNASGPPVRVAVLGQLDIPGLDGGGRAINVQTTASALQALVDLGAEVAFVDVTAEAEPDDAAVAASEALVVLGGGDVDAELYGVSGEVPNGGGVDRRSDERELRLMRAAIDRDAPLLAICRGSQLLNVARGGTLVPDLQPHDVHHGDTRRGEPLFVTADVFVEPDSIVGRALGGRECVPVRTGNHQAVDRPGEGLRVVASAVDGVVVATELTSATWITGVQWHPEEARADPADRDALFGALLDEARRRRARGCRGGARRG